MPPGRTNNRQTHDSVLARYNTFLENSRLDENGNPFSETIFRIEQRQDWALVKNKRILNSIEHNGDYLRHRADGPPSLFDIVRRFLNQNLKDLSIEALEGVPWSIMRCIWDDVLSSGQENVQTWTLFATVYGKEPDFDTSSEENEKENRCKRIILRRQVPIGSLIAPISSSGFSWLVDLDMQRSSGYTRYDFLELPQLLNLGALNISRHHQDLAIDDGIIRTWSMAAVNQGKFTKLKILIARNHKQITSRSLEYLGWVKSLEVLDLTGCGTYDMVIAPAACWRLDPLLNDIIDDHDMVWKMIRGEEDGNEAKKLILQVKVEVSPTPTRVDNRTEVVFRRHDHQLNTKRKQVPGTELPSEPAMERPDPMTKKPKILRKSKIKDMGSLLAEFGVYGSSSRYCNNAILLETRKFTSAAKSFLMQKAR
ncbi:hypothetical protein DFP73DRAFT_480209 [Morchella snyderi]|nr:hypothetical protein DFP73DRAFT_480209 [Morchella snyderi]